MKASLEARTATTAKPRVMICYNRCDRRLADIAKEILEKEGFEAIFGQVGKDQYGRELGEVPFLVRGLAAGRYSKTFYCIQMAGDVEQFAYIYKATGGRGP